MSQNDSHQIEIRCTPQFITEQPTPEGTVYVFAYTIAIRNVGDTAAQLLSRHWIITGAGNYVQEVRGLGVIGQQPLLQPGERFEYTSGCSLPTPAGTMRGSYRMVTGNGTLFDVDIPEFTLAAPHTLH